MKDSVNWDNHPGRVKMRGLESEVANLKNALAQKDNEINSVRSQISNVSQKDSEINSWKSYYNSAQSQVNSLNASLSQKNSEFNALKAQKDKERGEFLKQIEELKVFKIEAQSLKLIIEDQQSQIKKTEETLIVERQKLINEHDALQVNTQKIIDEHEVEFEKLQERYNLKVQEQIEFQAKMTEIIVLNQDFAEMNLDAQRRAAQDKLLIKQLEEEVREIEMTMDEKIEGLKNEIVAKEQKTEELEAIIKGEKENLSILQKNLITAEAKIDFMNKFFEDVKQEKLELKAEKLELKKEIKLYKKSFLKKHDLSVSQSIEIEKLKKEMLEMSSMSISRIRNFEEEKEDFDDDSDVLHTTFSYPIRSRINSDASEKLPTIKEIAGSENTSPAKTFKEIVFPLEKNETVRSEHHASLNTSIEAKLLGEEFSILENE